MITWVARVKPKDALWRSRKEYFVMLRNVLYLDCSKSSRIVYPSPNSSNWINFVWMNFSYVYISSQQSSFCICYKIFLNLSSWFLQVYLQWAISCWYTSIDLWANPLNSPAEGLWELGRSVLGNRTSGVCLAANKTQRIDMQSSLELQWSH